MHASTCIFYFKNMTFTIILLSINVLENTNFKYYSGLTATTVISTNTSGRYNFASTHVRGSA